MELLKVLLVFAIIIALLWRRAPLMPVMLAGSILLAALFKTNPMAFLGMVWRATKSDATVELVIILTLVMVLEHLLNQYGYLERMLKGLQGLIRDRRAVMALLPIFIGLMPSAGGALFSAPLVNQVAANTPITAEEKSFVNFYFRHIWEFILPFTPGILLASRISGVPLPHLVLALTPYALLFILLGLPALRRLPVIEAACHAPSDRRVLAKELLSSILPVLMVIFLALVVKVDIELSLGLVLIFLLARHRFTPSKIWRLCREAISAKTLLLVLFIMIFKQVLEDTHSMDGLPALLERLQVPEFVAFGLISFLVGLLTGLLTGYVGIAFPIMMAAMGGQVGLSMVVFVYVAGIVAQMVTPMHLCLALTVDFFKADLRKVIAMLVVPEATMLIGAVVLYLIM